MSTARPRAAVSWSGGKDSCAALQRARAGVRRRGDDHDVRRRGGAQPIARAAARGPGCAGRAARPAPVTGRCAWSDYDAAFSGALEQVAATRDHARDLRRHPVRGASAVGRAHLRAAGLTAVEPLWGLSTDVAVRGMGLVGQRGGDRHGARRVPGRVVARPRRCSRELFAEFAAPRRRSLRRARRVPHARHEHARSSARRSAGAARATCCAPAAGRSTSAVDP